MADTGESASFGDLVRRHRLAAALTQAALAERAGISVRAVQDIERSVSRPQRETARRLADALALTAAHRTEFDRAAAPAPRLRVAARRLVPRRTPAHEGQLGDGPGGQETLGGEHKRVTVLVAEVAGLTESVQGFEPDVADRLQTRIVPLLVEVVHRCDGTVNRVGGDGIMALFGAPLAREDDGVRACVAALALHEAFDRFAGRLGGKREPRLALRVGLASSDVVLRSARNDLYREYTALGPAIRAATRLAQVAADGTTVLTSETVRAAEGYIRARPVGPVPALAPSLAIEAFELLGSLPARTRFQRVVRTRRLTRFVGREAELASLALAFGRARAGHGQVAALIGDPGVGKSRLIWEAARSARTDGWLVLESGAVSHGIAPSYGPVIDLVKAYCRIEARDDGPTVREKLTGRILALDKALEPDLPALLSLLDVPVEDASWEALDPPPRRDRTLAALKRLLLRESQGAPLLLVFDDLHWIDGETQALLDALVESLPAAHILLLVSYRPEYEHRWGRKTYYAQLRIDALPPGSAEELLDALLGEDAALLSLKQHLIAKTEGNPLFLEESVRSLVEAGALVGARGAYRRARPIDTIRVPDTVQTVLMARIDRLDPEAKRLLQFAAVIGEDVPFSLLRALVEAPDTELHGALTRLLTAEFLYEARLFPEVMFTFKHALTREVAYGSLLQERRRTLHARIVDAIERTTADGPHADRIAEQVDRLGHHALQGQLWEKAVTYLRRAGRRDGARSANRQAATYFEQALEALSHLPDHRRARGLAIDIRLDLRNVLLPLDKLASMVDHLQTAEALAIALDDRHRHGWVSAYLAAYYCNAVKPREAEAAGLRAMAIADACADFPLQVMSHFFLGLACVYACRYRESIAALSWNVDQLRGERIYERFGEPGLPAVHSRSYLMRALGELGDFDEAGVRGQEAVRLSESTDLPFSLANALEGMGYVHLRKGEISQAITLLERGLQLCEQRQFHLFSYVVQAYLGYAYALAGRDAEAGPLLAKSAAIDWGLHPALRVTMQGEAHLLAGRCDQARQCVERALTLATVGEEHGSRGWTLRLAAEIELDHGPASADQAAAHYREALALAETLGMRPLRAHCHLGLGKLYRRIGRVGESQAELTTAVAMLSEMGMTHWLPEAEAELARANASKSMEYTGQ